ncbi:MAG: pantetheine-phosphate adenylyltransferase [Nitrosopumilus sp. D6]|nr:MAG: pantetheine-phosphate adenylyltransferase [Nitrosopumilus sp. D6]
MMVSAVGGTFDIIHRGHLALLGCALGISDTVIIGLASDGFARRRGKMPEHGYAERLENLQNTIQSKFPGKKFEIAMLDDDFGPAVLEERVAMLIVSEETAHKGDALNRLRAERGVGPVQVVIVPMVAAEDGSRLSTSRIRASEMDSEGRLTR